MSEEGERLMARTAREIGAALAIALAAAGAPAAAGARQATAAPVIHVLSNRADLLAGGDGLVTIALPRGTRASQLRVTLNGRSIRRQFSSVGTRQVGALVKGLREGAD